jgi:hypothetical protein
VLIFAGIAWILLRSDSRQYFSGEGKGRRKGSALAIMRILYKTKYFASIDFIRALFRQLWDVVNNLPTAQNNNNGMTTKGAKVHEGTLAMNSFASFVVAAFP